MVLIKWMMFIVVLGFPVGSDEKDQKPSRKEPGTIFYGRSLAIKNIGRFSRFFACSLSQEDSCKGFFPVNTKLTRLVEQATENPRTVVARGFRPDPGRRACLY